MRRLGFYGFLLAALALSGCFTSDDPIIGEDGDILPLALGRYTMVERENGDLTNWSGTFSLDGNVHVFTYDDGADERAEPDRVSFRRLAPGIYAAERCEEGNDCMYGVLVLQADGGAAAYMTDCGDLDPDTRTALGFASSGTGTHSDCNIADWPTLQNTLTAWLDEAYDAKEFYQHYTPE